MQQLKIIIINLLRLVLGAVLVFSGYVKAVDPMGTLYKLQDYLTALNLSGMVPQWLLLVAAVALAALEFCLGIFILFAIRRRLVSRVTLAFMVVMTLITIWLATTNPIKDCGCFGDAVYLTNVQTLIKNLMLFACAFIIASSPLSMVRFISRTNQWIAINFTILYILATSAYSLYTIPPFDFRPYHVGANIQKGMEIPKGAKQPQYETTFILKKNGVEKEFTLNNYPDSTWTFVDSKTVLTDAGYVPPIHDFSIMDGENDITSKVLNAPGYTFLLISPDLTRADDSHFGDVDRIYEYATEHGYHFYGLTASTNDAVERWRALTGAEYPFYTMDMTTLQTIIRSNPGMLLLKRGTIIGKWSHNNLPGQQELSAPLERSSIGKLQPQDMRRKTLYAMLWFFVPLLLLVLADRTWAWTKWLKKKERKNKIYQLLNKNNMRKKIVAGNWKMNMNLQDGVKLAKEINEALAADKPNCGVIICTPFIHLASVAQVLNQDVVALGAENCADKEKGAYTGEVSAEMVKSTGAQYVILGHSERRQYYHETAEILKEKVQLALKNGLKVIFCCGETLEEREANKQNEVVKAELDGSVFNLTADEWKNIVLAYEPIWAIGTGKTATAEQAEEMLAYIRSIVADKYGKEAAEDTTILYGGSCKPANAAELFAKPDIDGGLIGGASLKAADFKAIIDAWKK
ncbi:MAG: triose-phosphate isomerase [Prevotella sp.]|nr:triose-phosphate isomerase [Prevotella sp.]MDY4666742.1 triose-phosphate isomerase [Prevotella sp.]